MPVRAPHCKVCGSPHWLTQAHIWKGEPDRVEAQIKRGVPLGSMERRFGRISAQPVVLPPEELAAPALEPRSPAIVIEPASPNPSEKTKVAQEKFDKIAYQRDYMRKRREAAKAKR